MATQLINSSNPIDNDGSVVKAGGTNNSKYDSTVQLGGNEANFNLIGGAASSNRGFQSLSGGVPGDVSDLAKLTDQSPADSINDKMNLSFVNKQVPNMNPTVGGYAPIIKTFWDGLYETDVTPHNPNTFSSLDIKTSTFHNTLTNLATAIESAGNPGYTFKVGGLPTVGTRS